MKLGSVQVFVPFEMKNIFMFAGPDEKLSEAAERLGLNTSNLLNLTIGEFEKAGGGGCPLAAKELDVQKDADEARYGGKEIAAPECVCSGCSDFLRIPAYIFYALLCGTAAAGIGMALCYKKQ